MNHIAIVEDEPEIRANYAAVLERNGFHVQTYPNRERARAAFAQRLPDLVLLDIVLGDDWEGGYELCRELRAMAPALPIIFLTARDTEIDVVSGLRLGADDYVSKDWSTELLLARVRALLRRIASQETSDIDAAWLERGDLTLNLDTLVATWKAERMSLTVTEFWIVHGLSRHPGQVKTRRQLMDDARIVVDDTTVTSHIKRLRRKFSIADADFDQIESVYGAGYRWKP